MVRLLSPVKAKADDPDFRLPSQDSDVPDEARLEASTSGPVRRLGAPRATLAIGYANRICTTQLTIVVPVEGIPASDGFVSAEVNE